MKVKLIIFLFLFLSVRLLATNYYVAPYGSDLNPGISVAQPWQTWQKAFTSASAGDTVYFRGGIYTTLNMVQCNLSGTETSPIVFMNYPGETPILDGENKTTWSHGIYINNQEYINIKGLTVRNNHQIANGDDPSGIVLDDCNNIILESCVAHDNGKRGFYIYDSDAISIQNCDAYNNADNLQADSPGAGGDGFLIDDDGSEDDISSFVAIQGCRAWHNSDDGFEFAGRGKFQIQVCWSWHNGYLDGGDGIGFNYGLKDSQIKVYNNTSYRNGGYGFNILNTSVSDGQELSRIYRNNVAYYNSDTLNIETDALYTHDHNSWDWPPVAITNADFISVDSVGITGPRQIDGSLPDLNFLKLSPSSNLIDAGIDIGLPYNGLAPDLGAYEGGVSQIINSFSTSESIIINCIATDNTSDGFIANSTVNLLINLDRQADSLALVDLYNSTNGPGWTNNDNWLTGSIDTWYGITVSGDRVTEINLYQNNLVGTIPTSIGDLDELTDLTLAVNSLSGPIPVEISYLSNLNYLYLTDNQLSGNIPTELGDLTNLTWLWIGMNQFGGSIPPSLGQLTNLSSLELTSCQLTGEIPPELGNLTNLELLLLKDNSLSGTIPDQIWNLTNLTQFHVGINNLTGTIPSEIGNLSNLEFLQLYSNSFTGLIPEEIWGFTNLQSLQLNANQFSGQIPYDIGNLTNLIYLNLSSNNLSGPIPAGIADFTELRALDMHDNQFTALPNISSIPNLDSLHIQNNSLTFKDIEPNAGVASVSFRYSPQVNIVTEKDSTLYLGSEMYLMVSAGGANSRFQWYKDGSPLGVLSTDSILTISPVNLSDAGVYTCDATNILAPDLILSADPATLQVINAILVSNTDDSGIGSLRNAIEYANSNPGGDSIVFNILGAGVQTIVPVTPLPTITDPLVMDGYTQPGTAKATESTPATLLIELDGINLIGDSYTSGLTIHGGNSIIRGLIINRFGDDGIHIADIGGNIIEGNYIGIDASGQAKPNADGALRIWNSPDNTIGGDLAEQRNVMAGSGSHIIQMLLIESASNIIKGNYIGVGPNGDTEIGTSGVGILINNQAHHNIIGPNNVISGNDWAGISFEHNNPNNNSVIGNFIGTNANGTVSVANGDGIRMLGSSYNTIGGSFESNRNLISGNINFGIAIADSSHGNNIYGNYIGIMPDGTTALPNGAHGISINGSPDNTVGGTEPGEGNLISGNGWCGLEIIAGNAKGNFVSNNMIGTNASGDGAVSNGENGVQIILDASENIIGPGNIISGNINNGIHIESEGATNNIVVGNLIGTAVDGLVALGNGSNGINVIGSASNTIGGTTIVERNIISGNQTGIWIRGSDASNNTITGNYIGTDINGTSALGNGWGIYVYTDSTIIGGAEPGAGNVISGNINQGLNIIGNTNLGIHAHDNIVIGNIIGLDATGSAPLGNGAGLMVVNSHSNTIGGPTVAHRNIISGNDAMGLYIGWMGATQNRVMGNYIGTNIDGSQAIGNGSDGILLNGPDNIIGGDQQGYGNLVSGNSTGIRLKDSADFNQIIGNYIGLQASGNAPLGNQVFGIAIASDTNEIRANVVSGNGGDEQNPGIVILDGATANKLTGNFIGTNAGGTAPIKNSGSGINIGDSPGNIIGGVEADRNIIFDGIQIAGSSSIGNIVKGNFFGTDYEGKLALGDGAGIVLYSGASENFIGPGNIFSGITVGNPISIRGADTKKNSILGNLIGLSSDGLNAIPNLTTGIFIENSPENIIGGNSALTRNVISANGVSNGDHGIVITDNASIANKIIGNFIGLDATGKKAIGNGGDGVQIINGASDNIIGGSASGERNTISGNTVTGIAILSSANNNKILGNYIGPDASGLSNIGNGGSGIYLGEGASGNIIGDNVSGSGNYITGSRSWAGIAIDGVGTDNNLVKGNSIGTNFEGEEGFGNRIGLRIYNGASDNRIGGEEAKDGNIIANSTEEGVVIYNDAGNTNPTTGNMILSNIIHSNAGLGIDLGDDGVTLNDEDDIDSSPNNFQNYPVFDSLSFSPGTVTVGGYLNSMPGASYTLQFFASKVGDNTSYGEGQTLLGTKSFTTDSEGNVSFVSTFPILNRDGQVITATATDPDGNSSEFSRSIGGVKDHILADINKPFHYSINKDGIPKIYTEEDIEAIERAFQTWTDNSSAEIEFISDGTTDSCYASSGDGMNLVTFVDDRFPFAPGILAISAKTLKIDTLSMEAEILDADIVFNPAFLTSNQYSFDIADSPDDTMVFDIESVTAHEIGHVLGLIHSGAPLSTMFFMINTGTDSRSLEKDDIAWVNYRYPGSEYNSNYASIEGRVTYGDLGDPADPASHPPVAGALILAVDTLTKEQIHSYTDADGMYSVPLPANGTPVSYWIHVEPLDGDVFGTPLRPGNISSYIYSNTIYTDYRNEWYNGENESAYDNIDNVDTATVINVVAGETIMGIDIITNKDDSRPYVLSVSPSATEYIDTVEVLSEIMIHFSEDVDLKTFTGESCFLTSGDDSFGGRYWMLGDNASVIFLTPENPLQYDTEYNLHLSEEITDLKSNPLYFENEIACTFKTCLPDTVRPFIRDIIPEPGSDSVFVLSEIMVFFSEPMDPESAKEGFKLIDPMNQIVNGDFIWINVNKILTFIPERSLSESAEYYVTMTQGLEDHAGNPLKKDTTFVFTTVPDANPEIIYLGPGDGSTNIRVETPVVADFSEPVDINTIDNESFRLLQVGGGQVIGSFEFLMDNTRVVFRPENKLDFNTEYIIELSTAISDISIPAKTLISPVSSGFTTAEEPVLPYIQYIYPSAGVFGSVIMIHGSGFDPDPLNNSVVFCGKKAAILKSSLSDLAVKVPLGALSGDITVTVNGAISNAMYFDVLLQTTDPCEEVTANLNTGTRSRDVAITPDAGRALVTNPVTGTVSVVGLKLDNISIIETVAVGETPLKIDIDAKGKYAYVTNYTSHTVSVIDLDTYEVEHIKVGINPFGVVVSPEGKVYISNETSKDVSVIDVDPNSGGFNHVIANINTGTRNRDIDISPDAGIVLVTGDNGLTMINVNEGDINFNSVIANVNTGTRTRDIDITPEAGLAIVTTEAGDLFIVDIFPSSDAFGSVIANINTGTRSRDIEISPDAIFVYVTNAEGSLSVFKLDIGGVGGISTSYYRQVSLSLHSIIPAELIGANELEGIVIDYNAMKVYVVDPGNTGGSGQLIEITICCGPILPEKAIGNLIINIQNMLNSGLINAGNANALLTKLYNALNKVDKDQTKVAINILSALINQLEGLSETGQIPGDRADALIFAVNAIIFNIESTSFKSLDLKSLENTRGNVPGEGNFEKVFPNPFSEELSIYFTISSIDLQDVDVYIGIYNGAGQLVRILTDIPLPDGEYIVHWDGMLDNGNYAGDSAYFIYFRAGNYSDIKKVILQRRN